MSPTRESMSHYRSSSDINHGRDKLSLPNFSNFLAGAGHPDLAYRTEAGPNNSVQTSHYSTQSLPTPPSVNTQSWLSTDEKRPQPHAESPLYTPDHHGGHPFATNDYRRRQSIAHPISASSDASSARAFPFASPHGEHPESGSRPQGHHVREEVIPGKGLCYVYDDGVVTPKLTNGDPVNPKWGTTKAGKPRKRLGQACKTCREKKIKCDPNYPKCSQCQKLNRECVFEAPSRTTPKSPKLRASGHSPSTAYMTEEEAVARRSSAAPTEVSTPVELYSASTDKPSAHPDSLFSPSSIPDRRNPGFEPTPPKRPRLAPPDSEPLLARSPVEVAGDAVLSHDELLGFRDDLDPVQVDRKLVDFYLNIYFTCANVAAFGMFPPTRFCAWVRSGEKQAQDMMVVYSVLALATVFSKGSDKFVHRRVFTTIAHRLLESHVYSLSLQTVQTAHLLSLVEFASGDVHRAYMLGRQASSAACWLGMDNEAIPTKDTLLYGMSPAVFAECKRRSFWAVYITERFGGACLGHPLAVNQLDVCLRLPCDPDAFDNDQIPDTLFFDGDKVVSRWNKSHEHARLATMAHLIQIATLCSETQALAKRAKQNLVTGRLGSDSGLRLKLEQQLAFWEEGYSQAVKSKEQGSKENETPATTNSSNSAKGEKFSGLHILYHLGHMTLNRQIYYANLPKHEIANHVRKAHSHAMKTLEIAQRLVSRGGIETTDYGFASTAPLTAFAVFMAIDVVTATGTVSDVLTNQSRMMQLLYNGIELLGQLAEYWASAKFHHKLAQDRCQTVYTRVSASMMERKIAFYVLEPLSPMSAILGKEFDLIYGIDRMQYLRALGWANDITNENELLAIDMTPETPSHRGSRSAHSSI